MRARMCNVTVRGMLWRPLPAGAFRCGRRHQSLHGMHHTQLQTDLHNQRVPQPCINSGGITSGRPCCRGRVRMCGWHAPTRSLHSMRVHAARSAACSNHSAGCSCRPAHCATQAVTLRSAAIVGHGRPCNAEAAAKRDPPRDLCAPDLRRHAHADPRPDDVRHRSRASAPHRPVRGAGGGLPAAPIHSAARRGAAVALGCQPSIHNRAPCPCTLTRPASSPDLTHMLVNAATRMTLAISRHPPLVGPPREGGRCGGNLAGSLQNA